MVNKIIDWHFKARNPQEFNITLVMTADDKLFKRIFRMSRRAFKVSKRMDVKGEIDDVHFFKVPKFYFNFLNINLNSFVKKEIEDVIKKDKIVLLSKQVCDAEFQRSADKDWLIKITLDGFYKDLR